jgi:hypothetical protein
LTIARKRHGQAATIVHVRTMLRYAMRLVLTYGDKRRYPDELGVGTVLRFFFFNASQIVVGETFVPPQAISRLDCVYLRAMDRQEFVHFGEPQGFASDAYAGLLEMLASKRAKKGDVLAAMRATEHAFPWLLDDWMQFVIKGFDNSEEASGEVSEEGSGEEDSGEDGDDDDSGEPGAKRRRPNESDDDDDDSSDDDDNGDDDDSGDNDDGADGINGIDCYYNGDIGIVRGYDNDNDDDAINSSDDGEDDDDIDALMVTKDVFGGRNNEGKWHKYLGKAYQQLQYGRYDIIADDGYLHVTYWPAMDEETGYNPLFAEASRRPVFQHATSMTEPVPMHTLRAHYMGILEYTGAYGVRIVAPAQTMALLNGRDYFIE